MCEDSHANNRKPIDKVQTVNVNVDITDPFTKIPFTLQSHLSATCSLLDEKKRLPNPSCTRIHPFSLLFGLLNLDVREESEGLDDAWLPPKLLSSTEH